MSDSVNAHQGMATSVQKAALGVAIAFLVVGVLGFVPGITTDSSQANFVPVNTADNWLHLVLGLGMILLGVLLTRRMNEPAEPASHP